ncbi:WD repeat-containing protein 5-like [Bufo gargarizans]|uniref:WD repeat-containing protein 5-like n=1 Tax=Bufo gargarizans TaxID=30331 RepID=UPI001CF1E3EE|nr:WD repeat-containing protein 5-like [Bufo gargarizans]XP_044153944.1 WD repeat-containing protein 5-like [Bufo gargarizans]
MAALELRKLRKKLRQIETLEHLPRELVPSEIAKVAQKHELRRLIEELLSQTVEEKPKEETVETSGESRTTTFSPPDPDIQPSPPPAAASKRKKQKTPKAAQRAAPDETPTSARRLTDPYPLQNSQFLVHSLEGHSDLVTCVLIHDTYIISGSWDTSVRVWDVPSRSEVRTLCGHTGGVACMVMVYLDGTKLASDLLPLGEHFVCSGSSDCSIKVWSLNTVQPLLSIYTFSAVSAITHVPHTKLLISGSDGGKIDVWDLETQENLRSERAHDERVSALQFHSGLLYSGSSDGSLKVWRVVPSSGALSLQHACDPLVQSLRGLYSLCATADQLYLATQGSCIKAVHWKQDRLTLLSNHNSSSGFVDALAVTPDNLLIATGFNIDQGHGYLNIRAVDSGKYLCTVSCPEVPRLLCLAVSSTSDGLCRWVTGGRELLLWEELPRGGALDRSAAQVQFCPDFLLPAPDSESENDDEEDLWEAYTEAGPPDSHAEPRHQPWCALM